MLWAENVSNRPLVSSGRSTGSPPLIGSVSVALRPLSSQHNDRGAYGGTDRGSRGAVRRPR
jgi:hypothetical protein